MRAFDALAFFLMEKFIGLSRGVGGCVRNIGQSVSSWKTDV